MTALTRLRNLGWEPFGDPTMTDAGMVPTPQGKRPFRDIHSTEQAAIVAFRSIPEKVAPTPPIASAAPGRGKEALMGTPPTGDVLRARVVLKRADLDGDPDFPAKVIEAAAADVLRMLGKGD